MKILAILNNKIKGLLMYPVLYLRAVNSATKDIGKSIKLINSNKYDIVFYCARPFQETFIRSCIYEVSSKYKVAYVRNILDNHKDGEWRAPLKNVDTYYLDKKYLPLLSMKTFVTPETVSYKSQLPKAKYHIHMPHSLLSLHMVYPEDKFFNFNVLFASGDHHYEEYNKIHNGKNIVKKVGLGRIDYLKEEYEEYSKNKRNIMYNRSTILIAPSWHENNILEVIGNELSEALINEGYKVIFRPHYKIAENKSYFLEKINKKFEGNECFVLDIAGHNNKSLFESDIMICDYSGVAFEYSFITENPILFVDIPPKVRNKNWKNLNIDPIELKLRDSLGEVVDCNLEVMVKKAKGMIEYKKTYKNSIIEARRKYCYNYEGNVGKIASNNIEELLNQ